MLIPLASDLGAALPPVDLSLVVTTLGRTRQVEHLFRSLSAQNVAGFEVIIVDQNDDDCLLPVLEGDWPFPVRRLHTPGERGASRGRNRGWRLSRGSVLLFPDDDCWYPSDFLERSLAAMKHWGCDVLAGRAADETGRDINGRFEATARRTNRTNVWTTAIEWVVLFHRTVLERIDGFDEEVGVGAASPWQSCEIQDIIIRAMDAGFLCWFDPAIAGHHEEIVVGRPDERVLRKARGYARGMGFVLRLHGYDVLTIAKWVARPLGGGLLALARGRGRTLPYYGQVALGRLEGALRRTFGSA
jgi:glycosyltransferase involved in cell wall biosynthesis